MTIQQEILERLSALPPSEQQELLRFTRALAAKAAVPAARPWNSLMGLLADRGTEVTDADIADARREMWGNFPRDVE